MMGNSEDKNINYINSLFDNNLSLKVKDQPIKCFFIDNTV